jgi:hypothetical protein
MEPAKRSAPANANGTAKAAPAKAAPAKGAPAKAVGAKKVPGTAKASTSAKATAATKKATAKAPGAAKAAGAAKKATAKATGTAERATGPAKKATGAAKTKQTRSGAGRSSRRDLSGLIAEVRAALDDLAQKGDTATKQGRDRVKEQVAHVEVLWSRVRHEVGLSRHEGDAAVENLRSALGKAEETVTHMIDTALKVLKKD